MVGDPTGYVACLGVLLASEVVEPFAADASCELEVLGHRLRTKLLNCSRMDELLLERHCARTDHSDTLAVDGAKVAGYEVSTTIKSN